MINLTSPVIDGTCDLRFEISHNGFGQISDSMYSVNLSPDEMAQLSRLGRVGVSKGGRIEFGELTLTRGMNGQYQLHDQRNYIVFSPLEFMALARYVGNQFIMNFG